MHSPDYKASRTSRTDPTALPAKIGKALCPHSGGDPNVKAANQANYNAGMIRPKVSEASWDTFFRMCMNALPFSKRLYQAKMTLEIKSCLFCGEPGMDSHKHTYGSCPVVDQARETAAGALGVLAEPGMLWAVLGSRPLTVAEGIFVCAFNYAVWRCRTHYLVHCPSLRSISEIITRVVDGTICGVPLKDTTKAAELATRDLAMHPPDWALCGYSDGSALGTPGPTGGGFVIIFQGQVVESESIPLGKGDNNLGEMGALLWLFRRIELMVSTGEHRPRAIIIFSDSAGCVGYLTKGWTSPTREDISRATRDALFSLRSLIPTSLRWIRGHCGVFGNDKADAAAKEGAELAKQELEGGRHASEHLCDPYASTTSSPTSPSYTCPPPASQQPPPRSRAPRNQHTSDSHESNGRYYNSNNVRSISNFRDWGRSPRGDNCLLDRRHAEEHLCDPYAATNSSTTPLSHTCPPPACPQPPLLPRHHPQCAHTHSPSCVPQRPSPPLGHITNPSVSHTDLQPG